MLEKFTLAVGLFVTLLGMAAGLVAAYQQMMFVQEWLEDHAGSAGFFRRQLLSVAALFSVEMSERCYRRRRLLLLWMFIFFAFMVVDVVLVVVFLARWQTA
jgi:hypothetical protein